jgi:hypothetical protein
MGSGRHARHGWHRLAVLACVVLVQTVLLAGCTTIRSMMPSAREAEKLKLQMQEWQARGMRFADE